MSIRKTFVLISYACLIASLSTDVDSVELKRVPSIVDRVTGDWRALVYQVPSGHQFCAAETTSGSSIMRIVSYFNGDSFIEFVDPNFRFPEGSFNFDLRTDRNVGIEINGRSGSNGSFWFDLNDKNFARTWIQIRSATS